MDPFRQLKSELERGIFRAWESLADGWREVLGRSGGALTHFVRGSKEERGDAAHEDFPRWGMLASESWETAQSVIVRLEMPGMNKDEIDVSIHRGSLWVRGEKRSGGEQQGRFYHLMERAYGRFERNIPLPGNIDAAGAEVSYQDGVVTVIVPKTEESPPTRLSLK
jgi:HSP20 family protein